LPAVQLLLLFVAYVVLINVMWATALGRFSLSGRDGLLIHPSYYVFNAAICLAGIVLNARFGRAFILITTYGAVLSVLLQTVASVFVHGGGDSRGMLFFNSPNQLGYYAVLCSTIVVFGAKRVPVSRWIVAGVFFSSGYLAVISMSRAAIIAVGVLAVLTLLSRPSAMLLAFGLFMAAFQLFDPAGEVLEHSVVRLQSISETDPGRGYDRIWQHPEYWLMGAGEGALDRFPDTQLEGHELHSSLGTLFFSYGVIGTLLFAGFLFHAARRGGVLALLQLTPAALYGLAHQGLRFSLVWVMVALIISVRSSGRTSCAQATEITRTTAAPGNLAAV
jgi:hypothetical protein